jgi:hypothetical protein
MTLQTIHLTSEHEIDADCDEPFGLQPLVRSLRAILQEIDDEYERERDKLCRTLPDTLVKDRALAMLKARHRERRKNYVRELTAILGPQEA